jgi:hypothetical protein
MEALGAGQHLPITAQTNQTDQTPNQQEGVFSHGPKLRKKARFSLPQLTYLVP